MPKIKKRQDRLQLLDTYLRSGWYSQPELLEIIEDNGFERISQKALQLDLEELRNDEPEDPIACRYFGRVKRFRYKDKSYSYTRPVISDAEIMRMKEAISLLNKYKLDLSADLAAITEKLGRKLVRRITHSDNYLQLENADYSGDKHILDILDACSQKTVLKVRYKPFHREEATEYVVHPHILKEWNQRWFLICTNEEHGSIMNLALDRVEKIRPAPLPHNNRKISDITDDFKTIVGVTLDTSVRVEEIIFRVRKSRAGYVRTKRLHHSQLEISSDESHSVFSLQIRPNKEFYALVLSFGPDFEIISPSHVRLAVKEMLKENLQSYE